MQAKLAVGPAGDDHEREADRVSAQVNAAPAAGSAIGAAPRIRRVTGTSSGSGLGAGAAPAAVDHAVAGSGISLEPRLRQDMEQRFGEDFSGVRVHSDPAAAQSARDVNAHAYTVGRDIVFGAGQFAPTTPEGRRLIAHELTHVVQQGAGGSVAGGAFGAGGGGLMVQREVVDPRTLKTQSESAPRHIRVGQWLVEPVAGGGTAATEVYFVQFDVDDKGVMRAEVRTVTADRKYRSGLLRFGDRFRAALQHFNENGVEVNAFEGDWSYMTKDEISTNLEVFREEMAKGATREKAALETPSGKVAARSGFVDVVSVENVLEPQEHLAEEGVSRWRVKAVFRRPAVAPEPEPGPGPAGGGGRPGSRTPGGGAGMSEPELEEGGADITAEEQEAIAGPAGGGGGGPSLLMMVGQWLMKDVYARQAAEIERLSRQRVSQEADDRVKGLEYLTMALQMQGEIAYAQVTVTRTTTSYTVYDLKALTVSSWYRQWSEDTTSILSGGDITTHDDTSSFALPLLPDVIKIAAAELQNRIDQLHGATSAQSQQWRAKLERCRHLLLTKGPQVPSFGFLGSECIDVLPMGRPPGS